MLVARHVFGLLLLAVLLLVPAQALAEEHEPAAAVPTPAAAKALLTGGNVRFTKGTTTHPHQTLKRLLETKGGQHPYVTVLSCSDSRVPPEVIFDAGIGDVFSVRVAGNVADTDEMGSIEYGVEHLGTPLLVVMGHTKCGAVTAVATGATVHGHIPALVAKIDAAVAEARKAAPGAADADLVPEATRANVFGSMATLLRESESVRARVESGKAEMVGAIYDIATGNVQWLGPHPDEESIIATAKKNETEHGEEHKADKKPEHGAPDAGAKEQHAGAFAADAPANADGGAAQAEQKDGGAAGAANEEKAGEHPGGAPGTPVPAPFAFAIVALVCTLGGAISGRGSKGEK